LCAIHFSRSEHVALLTKHIAAAGDCQIESLKAFSQNPMHLSNAGNFMSQHLPSLYFMIENVQQAGHACNRVFSKPALIYCMVALIALVFAVLQDRSETMTCQRICTPFVYNPSCSE